MPASSGADHDQAARGAGRRRGRAVGDAPWDLPAGSEFEGCVATWYDFSDLVPARYLDPTGERFRWRGLELRQDPQSHHLLLYYSRLNGRPGGMDVSDPSFGTWTCFGGPRAGEVCVPKDLGSCGDGVCASQMQPTFGCVGYGPVGGGAAEIVGGAGQAQAFISFPDGVFQELPVRGVMFWNTHGFNLTTQDHQMNGRVNYYFANDLQYPAVRISDFSAVFRPNNPPFTKETFCSEHVFPIGSRVFQLFSHTHGRGEHFWATAPDGTMIYENFDFRDPVQARYEPPLEFDSPVEAARTVRYCATYNNGLNEDGSFNVETVTRASRVPESARRFLGACEPVACVNDGMVGEPCRGESDNVACDSSAGAGDGFCDACPVTGGESTQNEMFVLFGAQYIDPSVPGAGLDALPR